MIQIIIYDKETGNKWKSYDHDPSNPNGDVHEIKPDIYDIYKSSGKINRKEFNNIGKNGDIGISDGEIVIISRINKGKILKTGINAEDFFILLFFMLDEVEIFDKKNHKKISWEELRRIAIREERKEKLISLSVVSEGQKKYNIDDREIVIEFRERR